MLLLALSLVFALFSCNGTEDEPCDEHTDDDEDGFCDVCEECVEHFDDDEDGYCDVCEEEMEDAPVGDGIALIADDEILFQIVLGSDIGSAKMIIDDFVDILEELGYEISVVDDSDSSEEADVEILVGTVSSRGEDYEYDKYSLGSEGYIISAVDETKIIINGGSETTLADAFTIFAEDFLGINEDTEELEDFTFTEEHETVEIQDNYRIDSITLAGNDLKGYEIVRDKNTSEHKNAAEQLQNFFYTRAGYWLPIVNPNAAGDKTISFVTVEKDKAGSMGFRVRVDGDNLLIECAYNNLFEKAFEEYYNATFTGKTGDIELVDFTSDKINISVIKYSDFGAVGDGKTDDSAAIRAAHETANKGGQTVYGEKGKTYYIPPVGQNSIKIMTNVDWKGAKFIFDSSAITSKNAGHVFQIVQDTANINVTISEKDSRIIELNKDEDGDGLVIYGINHGDNQTTKLDLGLGYPAMLTVTDLTSSTYIRWGYVDSKLSEQKEVIIVDKDGNIDPSTPFLLDYEKVTSIVVHRIDVEPITVQNATVRHPASRINLFGATHYYSQGILVSRPHTTVKGITHVIEGEIPNNAPVKVDADGLSYDVTNLGFSCSGSQILKDGKPYSGDDVKPFRGPAWNGFIQVNGTHNALIQDCVFQARVYYYTEGTYDLGANTSNKIVFENCKQSNFFDESAAYTKGGTVESTFPNMSTCWGIMGSNYTKNMEYINSELTRYDAHAGVFNGKIVGGKIAVLRLIGGGTFTIEDTEVYRSYDNTVPFQLREDYGATFFGTIIVRNTKIKYGQFSASGKYGSIPALFSASSAPWDNGYVNHFPNIIIDNITIETDATEVPLVMDVGEVFGSDNHYPERNIIREDVSNPNAKFAIFYETANPNLVEENPDMFPYLKDFKKVDTSKITNIAKIPTSLKAGEYTYVAHGDGTYTMVAAGVPNINPYQPPEFIQILNMKNATNPSGKPLKITLYNCKFFQNVNIIDEDKVLKRVNPK